MKKLFMILALGAACFTACSDEDNTAPGETVPAGEISLAAGNSDPVVSEGGTVEVTVTSNAEWRLIGKQVWCHASAEKGKSGDKVVFTVDPNEEDAARTVVYKFFCGDKTVPLEVKQEPGRIFTIQSDTDIPMTVEGGVFYVRTSGNVEFDHDIQADAAAWVTLPETRSRAMSRTLAFNVSANDTYLERTGHILLKGAGKDLAITIVQEQKDMIIPGQLQYDANPLGDVLTITLQSNIDFTVQVPAKSPWVREKAAPATASAQTLPGLSERTLTLEVDATRFTREAEITLKGVDSDFSTTFKIRQQGSVEAVVTDIPDANFRNWLVQNDYVMVLDGATCQLLDKGYDATTITCAGPGTGSGPNISSVQGLGDFPNLTSANFNGHVLTSVPLGDSQITSFTCASNSKTVTFTMTVSGKNLTSLTANSWYYAPISIDVSECPALNSLNVSYNMKMSVLYLKTGQTIANINKSQAANYRTIYK